ncbi:hypothetical protein [Okeania sp. SIO2B9]|uniref:hypothetical protein n=1 Tax=Okeania sp. SIO2B9 TaxID=2607782 RepID=UPI00142B2648|nr:hypothetical protein [Okeania sp. SIO2B9]NES93407.1 hypothetical protein [Okeania sp. SIO2B9]
MAISPFYSGRIPQELFDHIENFREVSGEGKTDLLIKALAQYTGFELDKVTPKTPPIREELNSIYERLENLEELFNDNKKIKFDNKNNQLELLDDNKPITSDNTKEILILSTNKTVEETGVSQSSLSSWKNNNQLPKIYTNKESNQKFEIDIESDEYRKTLWRVRYIDNG